MPNDKDIAGVVWIDGEPYTPNHPVAKAFANRQLMAGLGGAKPKHDVSRPLDQDTPEQTQGGGGPVKCRVVIVRYGKKRLDSDNCAFAHKALRDAIAEILGVTDAD